MYEIFVEDLSLLKKLLMERKWMTLEQILREIALRKRAQGELVIVSIFIDGRYYNDYESFEEMYRFTMHWGFKDFKMESIEFKGSVLILRCKGD